MGMDGEYVGPWLDDLPDGHGSFQWTTGGRFVGPFKRGRVRGNGVYFWSDGRVDLGHFRGHIEEVPILAAMGDGVRWSKDRSVAWLLRDGIQHHELTVDEATVIEQRLGLCRPDAKAPRKHTEAVVTSDEIRRHLPEWAIRHFGLKGDVRFVDVMSVMDILPQFRIVAPRIA